MLIRACTPIQMPMPCTIRPANTRSSAIAWRPTTKMRRVSQKKATMTTATPRKPSSSPITASRKSVCASGR